MPVSKGFSLTIIFASSTLTIMAGSIIAPVLNLMRDGLGVAPSYIGFIITTHGLFMAFLSPFMGSIVDRKGVRWLYIIALLCYGLAGGSGLLINSFWVLLVSRACLGIALAGIFTCINVLILNMYEGIERDKVMGWRGTAQSFGGVIWPLVGGLLGGSSWHFPFAVYMLAIPIGLLAIIGVPEPVIQRQSGQGSGTGTSVFRVFQDSPTLFIIYGLIFSGNILLYAIVIFMPQLLDSFGINSTFQIGLFISIMTTSSGLTSFMYGKIRARSSYLVIVIISVTLWTLSFIVMSQASSSLIVAIATCLFGISLGLNMPTVMVWIGEVVPSSFRGRFSSYLGTFGFVGQFLSPIIFAPIFVMLGLKGIFLVGAGVGAAWFLILLAVILKTLPRKAFSPVIKSGRPQ